MPGDCRAIPPLRRSVRRSERFRSKCAIPTPAVARVFVSYARRRCHFPPLILHMLRQSRLFRNINTENIFRQLREATNIFCKQWHAAYITEHLFNSFGTQGYHQCYRKGNYQSSTVVCKGASAVIVVVFRHLSIQMYIKHVLRCCLAVLCHCATPV